MTDERVRRYILLFIYLFNMKFVQQYTAKTLVKKNQKTMEENTTSY